MIEQLIHQIKTRQAELHVALATGGAVTWESYQRMVGEYQGLQVTLNMIDNIIDERDQAESSL
jgi:hypothetical protein